MATAAKKSTAKKTSSKKASGKRELIEPNGNKRYARRSSDGTFSEMDDQAKSLAQDVRKHSKTPAKSGYGDRGDKQTSKGSPGKASAKKSGTKKSSAKKSASKKRAG